MNDFNAKVNAIKQAIELEVDIDDISGLQGKMNRLINLISLSSELKARAEKDKLDAELRSLKANEGKDYSPTIFKKVIEAESSEYHAKLILADRLNAGIIHAIDGLRTMISLKKEEMSKSIL